jgi:hypothetical protein
VVLHLRRQDSVARFYIFQAPAIGNQIQTFGCAAGKNYFPPAFSVDEMGYFFAGLFVSFRRFSLKS